MTARTIVGSLLVLAGFVLGYYAVQLIGGWQYRNQAALGIARVTPIVELVLGFLAVACGLWLLFTRPRP